MDDTYYRGYLDVSVQAQEKPNMRVMRGKALLDTVSADFKFVENTPRGARSVEIGRTLHSRCVRRPDGQYTLTFRFDAGQKYLRESVIAEVQDIIAQVGNDYKVQQKKRKEAEKDGEA